MRLMIKTIIATIAIIPRITPVVMSATFLPSINFAAPFGVFGAAAGVGAGVTGG